MADPTRNAALGNAWRPRTDDRAFRRGLAGALALHSLFLVGLWHAPFRTVGDPTGTDDPINVEIVTADQMTGTGQPAAAAPAPQPPAQAPEPATEPAADLAATALKPTLEPAEKPADAPPLKQSAAPSLANLADEPDLLALPNPKAAQKPPDKPADQAASTQHQQQNQPQKKKPIQTSKLDLSLPGNIQSEGGAAAGYSAATSRPPNITRSPQNDAFGRAVIAALRVTMPPPEGPSHRVTIRILLNTQGNATEVSVVRRSDDPSLDQSVRFSALQASFPIPPAGSTDADRTFLVTYIYN